MSNDISLIESFLNSLGNSPRLWLFLAFVFVVLFFITLREAMGWFLRVPHLRHEIASLKDQLGRLEQKLDRQVQNSSSAAPVKEEPLVRAGEKSSPAFLLHH